MAVFSVFKGWISQRPVAFLVLLFFLLATFLMGGQSRENAPVLLLLRPLTALAFGISLLLLRREQIVRHKWLITLAAATLALPLMQLLPLPPGIWHALPGRDVVIEIDHVAGLGAPWRPLSLAPDLTWNAFFTLLTPATVLLLGLQLRTADRRLLLPVVICFALVSGLIGLLQGLGGGLSPVDLNRAADAGSASGLFSNRNHQAALLAVALPMLAVWSSIDERRRRPQGWVATGGGLLLIVLILVTGSRAGLMLGLFGLVASWYLYTGAFQKKVAGAIVRPQWFWMLVGLLLIAFVVTVIISSRTESLQRLSSADLNDELRFRIWNPTWIAVKTYMPVGSGLGSFVAVFKIFEPNYLLSATYRNHAHNDFLEIFLTAGVAGIALLGAALVGWIRCTHQLFRTRIASTSEARVDVALGRLGSFVIAGLGLASLVDYPLRTPSLEALAMVAIVWLVEGRLVAHRIQRDMRI